MRGWGCRAVGAEAAMGSCTSAGAKLQPLYSTLQAAASPSPVPSPALLTESSSLNSCGARP
jgi:hypothetical protein